VKLTWSKAVWILGASLLGIALLSSLPGRPIVNTSPSEPYGLYWVTFFPDHTPTLHLGELVLFHYRAPAWAKGRYDPNGSRFLKQVGALPGSWLFTRGMAQWSCPSDHFTRTVCEKLGTMLRKDPKGRLMHWPVWNGYRIPDGYYYMRAVYVPTSYDSRYYGLVSDSQLIGKLTPLFTFGK
jgi:type IV secretory pathway protease TraF